MKLLKLEKMDDKILSDKNGNPKTLYHGTNADFDNFILFPEKSNLFGGGIYFTDSKQEAIAKYTGSGSEAKLGKNPTVISVNLKVQKLADLRDSTWNVDDIPVQNYLEEMDFSGLVQRIKSNGYDCIIHDGSLLPLPVYGSHYIVFNSDNIIIKDKEKIY